MTEPTEKPAEGADGSGNEGESSPSEATEEPSLTEDLDELRTILDRTSQAHRIEAFFEGLLWYVAGAGGVVITALVVGLAFPAARPGWTGWILMLGGGAVGVAALGGLVRFFTTGGQAEGIARRLQDVEPSFRNDLVAALEFAETMLEQPEASDATLGFSRQLARRHVRNTVEQVRDRTEDRSHLGALLPDRHFEPPLLAVVGCMTLLAGSALL
ncbi:MAG: hypothetical protein ABEN55_22005, partial [Bradymonadaceae bacterium]